MVSLPPMPTGGKTKFVVVVTLVVPVVPCAKAQAQAKAATIKKNRSLFMDTSPFL